MKSNQINKMKEQAIKDYLKELIEKLDELDEEDFLELKDGDTFLWEKINE